MRPYLGGKIFPSVTSNAWFAAYTLLITFVTLILSMIITMDELKSLL